MHSTCLCNCVCMSVCTAFTQVCAHTMMHFMHVLCSASHIPVLASSSAPAMATSSSPPAMATGGGLAPQQRLPAEHVLKVPFCTAKHFGPGGWKDLQEKVKDIFSCRHIRKELSSNHFCQPSHHFNYLPLQIYLFSLFQIAQHLQHIA